MNNSARASVLLAVCAIAVPSAVAPADPAPGATFRSAEGEGSMIFGHDDDGRGYLRFTIEDGDDVTGNLLFAAEHHHEARAAERAQMFPDVVIRLGRVKEAEFSGRSVMFVGPGELHDDPVTVRVRAVDGGPKRHDQFEIECTDPGGRVVFEAAGELFRGDIRIGGM